MIPPIITGILFGGSFIAAKYALEDLGPLSATLLRYGVALLFLWLLLPWQKKDAIRIKRNDLPQMFLLGLFGIAGYHYFFFTSLNFTDVANTAIINASSPMLTALAAAFFVGETLKKINYIGVLFAFAGVLLLITKGQLAILLGLNFNPGDLLMLCAVLCWVVYALLIKNIANRYSAFTTAFYATFMGVFMLAVPAILEGLFSQLSTISSKAIWGVLYMGTGASGLAFILYNKSIAEIGATKTSGVVYSLVPLVAAVLAWLFFSDPLTPVLLISAALIIVGLMLLLKNKHKTEKTS